MQRYRVCIRVCKGQQAHCSTQSTICALFLILVYSKKKEPDGLSGGWWVHMHAGTFVYPNTNLDSLPSA